MKEYTLVGVDGNAFAIMGYTRQAMRKAGFTALEITDYVKKAMGGDYNNVIVSSMKAIDEVNKRLKLK